MGNFVSNGLFARWRIFTTKTRIHFAFPFIFKFGSLSEVSHWRTPRQERLIIWDRNSTGSGFPLTYMPPSWLSLPSPAWKTFVILLSFSRPMYLMWTYTPFAIAGWMLKIITSWYTDPKTTNRQRCVFKNKLNVCYQVPECFNLHVVNMFFFCSEVLYGS